MKIVVFDLDETLGYFVEYGIFWDCLKKYLNEDLNQNEFDEILDIYSEFLRPNIMNILIYLKNKKTTHKCQQIMMYTNNQKAWASQLISYFETKLNFKLFDIQCCVQIGIKMVLKIRKPFKSLNIRCIRFKIK